MYYYSMFQESGNADNLYFYTAFVIAVVFLIIVFLLLKNNETKGRSPGTSHCVLESDDFFELIEPSAMDAELSKKRELLMEFRKIHVYDAETLKRHTSAAHKELALYISACGAMPHNMTQAEIPQELMDQLMSQFMKLKTTANEYSDEETEEELVACVAEVIMDIDTILSMLRSGTAPNKALSITQLNVLISYIGQTTDTAVPATGDTPTVEEIIRATDYTVDRIQRDTIITQNIQDVENEFYVLESTPPIYKTKKINEYKRPQTYVSQEFDCPKDYILTSKNTQPSAPTCDINQLRSERKKIQRLTTDLNFARSLSADYDFLDV